MSKTSLDFWFLLRRQSKSEGLGLSSEPLRKQKFTQRAQKVMVCELLLLDFDPFCVFVELQSSHVFEKRSKFSLLCALSIGRICALMFCRVM